MASQEQNSNNETLPSVGHAEAAVVKHNGRLGVIFGCTVAKALVLLDQSRIVLIRVQTGRDDFSYLAFDPKRLRDTIAAHPLDDPMPSKYDMNTRELVIGSPEALTKAEPSR